jgi:NACalpha-BTF3-like transcription factor
MLTLPIADEVKSVYFELELEDIDLVATQADVEWEVAAQVLRENKNDIVNAIMALSV